MDKRRVQHKLAKSARIETCRTKASDIASPTVHKRLIVCFIHRRTIYRPALSTMLLKKCFALPSYLVLRIYISKVSSLGCTALNFSRSLSSKMLSFSAFQTIQKFSASVTPCGRWKQKVPLRHARKLRPIGPLSVDEIWREGL